MSQERTTVTPTDQGATRPAGMPSGAGQSGVGDTSGDQMSEGRTSAQRTAARGGSGRGPLLESTASASASRRARRLAW